MRIRSCQGSAICAGRNRYEGELRAIVSNVQMIKGHTMIFCGDGKGKSMAALGKAMLAASHGKSVMIIQFLKEKEIENMEYFRRLEPEIKLFRFERSEKCYLDMNEEEREEEKLNIRNGLNFARKVLGTQGCDVLILDEVLGLLDTEIVSEENILELMDQKADEMDLILTGLYQAPELWDKADEVTVMQKKKP